MSLGAFTIAGTGIFASRPAFVRSVSAVIQHRGIREDDEITEKARTTLRAKRHDLLSL
jgi:hypothetical protein